MAPLLKISLVVQLVKNLPAMQETWVRSLVWEDLLEFARYKASLVAQMVKRLPTMWETWVRSLVWEDPLEKGIVTHSSILAWRIQCSAWGPTSQTQLSDFHFSYN